MENTLKGKQVAIHLANAPLLEGMVHEATEAYVWITRRNEDDVVIPWSEIERMTVITVLRNRAPGDSPVIRERPL